MQRTSRFSTQARDAWIASLVQEAGGCLPYGCTPPHDAATDRSDACPQDEHVCSVDRDAGTVTDHGGAAIGNADATHESILCRGAGRLASIAGAGGRSRLPYRLDAAACCGSVKSLRLPEAAEGCPQGEHSWLAAKRDLYAWLGVTRTTNKWFQPKGAYSRMPVEGRIGSRWRQHLPPYSHRLGGRGKPRPNAQESRSKLGRIRMWSGSFSGKETP